MAEEKPKEEPKEKGASITLKLTRRQAAHFIVSSRFFEANYGPGSMPEEYKAVYDGETPLNADEIEDLIESLSFGHMLVG